MSAHPSHLTHPKYRPDIDGLHAIAILAVVGFHAFPNGIHGGFIGVDIFFVISGYLISTIIMGSLERNSFSFVDFYIRRINRIFPALLLVLIACYAFGWIALFASEYKQLGKHIAGGAGFISNYLFWGESGYFDNVAETKPLLHLWSLGIEEQYYIIWPLLLWFVWKNKFNLLSVTLIAAIISFGLNVAKINGGHSVDAFYSPQTRFWELLIGSVLAYITLHHQTIFEASKHRLDVWLGKIIYVQAPEANGKTLHNVQSLLGATFFLIGFVLITKESLFPGWWAVLPTLGAALIISAGAQAWFNRVVLSHPVLVWFGLISFPLYLWHWPLLSFARIMEVEKPSSKVRIAAVLISIILAWLTYKLIERPIRLGGHSRGKTITLIVLMCVVGYVGYNTFERAGLDFRYKKLEKYTPQLDWLMNSQANCVDHFGSQYQYCLIDDVNKKPKILLLGDSNANHLFPGLNAVTRGENLLNIGRGACLPFVDVSTRLVEGEMDCQSAMKSAISFAIENESVKTVVLSMMGAAYINNKRDISGGLIELHSAKNKAEHNPSIIFEAGMRETLKLLQTAGKQVIFVISTPRLNFSPATCFESRPFRFYKNNAIKQPCGVPRAVFDQDNRVYRELVFRVLKDFPKVKIFDTASKLCDDQYCWAMKDDNLLYRDNVHLSAFGSEYIAREMVRQLPTELLSRSQE